MLICLCHGVSDKQIKKLVASGARDVRQISAMCKAGGDCGKCVCELKQLVRSLQSEADGLNLESTSAKRNG